MIIEQRIDNTATATFYRYVWQQPSGAVYHFKLKAPADDAQLSALAAERDDLEQYQHGQPFFDNPEAQALTALVELFKMRPNISANQFNTYANTLPWYDEQRQRYWIFRIAEKLAERKEADVQDFTEAQAFTAVRNFIRDTPVRRLAKLFLNQFDL